MLDHFCDDEVIVTSIDVLYGAACSHLWLKLLKNIAGNWGLIKLKHLSPKLLILIRANGEDAAHLQGILDLYEVCSGQVINKVCCVVQ